MLNLDEPLIISNSYFVQRDLYVKSFLYSIGVVFLITFIRSQVPEINLLQLIPGFYLILLFLGFIFLVFSSDLLVRIPIELDNNKSLGTKTIIKLEFGILLKLSLLLLFGASFITINNVLPVSLDSFDSYGEKTLENIWSFDEVLNLETSLLFIIIILSQLPILAISNFGTEKIVNTLPQFWKILSFLIFLIAGFLTPTIDGYTQLSFSASAIFLYLIIINIIQKKINTKFNGTSSLGF
jgi:hypothetical protein